MTVCLYFHAVTSEMTLASSSWLKLRFLTAFDKNSRNEGFLCMWNVTLHPRYYAVVGRHSPSHVILRTVRHENEPFYLPRWVTGAYITSVAVSRQRLWRCWAVVGAVRRSLHTLQHSHLHVCLPSPPVLSSRRHMMRMTLIELQLFFLTPIVGCWLDRFFLSVSVSLHYYGRPVK